MDNFNDILNSLNEINKSYEIFIPSLNCKVGFTGLTAKQQKEVLQTVLDRDLTGISFSILVSDIIINNLTDKNINLLSIDRNYIITCLRIFSLSSKYRNLDDEEVDLTPILSNNIPLPQENKSITLNEGDLQVIVEIPSLNKDRTINIETRKRILAASSSTTEITKDALGELYIGEIIKFIKSLKTPKTEVIFNDATFNQKFQIVEKLPLSITSKIVTFINSIKDFDKKLFMLNNKEVNIAVDPTLFTL
jgi:hypothetical protein